MFVQKLKNRERKRREKLRAVIDKSCTLLQSKDGLLRAIDVKN